MANEIINSSPSTIEAGLNLISEKPKISDLTLAKLQVKELGLSVILLGLAEKSAERIGRLQKVIDKLEKEIFDTHIIDSLTDDEKVERYNMAVEAISASANYIKNTVNSINWDDLEVRLAQISANLSYEGGDSQYSSKMEESQIRDVARQLLSEISPN